MHGTLTRGDFVKLAYRLGREAATGALLLDEEGGAHELYLRRGYLTAAHVEGRFAPLGELLRRAGSIDDTQLANALGRLDSRVLTGRALRDDGLTDAELEAALRRQAELRLERLASIQAGTFRFLTAAPPPPAQRTGRPFALTTWARRHAEARVDAARVRAASSELASGRLVLRKDLAPDPIDLDETDRRIVTALASPRSFDDVEKIARAPRFRLVAFLHFLRTVGALDAPAAVTDPRRTLGVSAVAGAPEIKAAYRRLARALHPDMHPGATDARRRELAAEFARITAAYDDLC